MIPRLRNCSALKITTNEYDISDAELGDYDAVEAVG